MGLCEYDKIDEKSNKKIVRLGYADISDVKKLIANCYKKLGFKEFGRFIACEIEN